jgi:hypothetical protein
MFLFLPPDVLIGLAGSSIFENNGDWFLGLRPALK